MNPQAGLWGKLPTHGDFVGRGLPDGFRAGWDRWASTYLVPRKGWPAGGLRLRIAVPGRMAAGLVLPSRDAVGRHFPLGLFVLADQLPGPDALEPWCDAARAQAQAGVDPDVLWQALTALPCPQGTPAMQAPPLLLWRQGEAAMAADALAPGPVLARLFSSD